MRLLERNPWLWGLGVGLAVFTLTGARAGAQVLDISSTKPGSLVIFPKLIADGTRDSIVAITNTSNLMVFAHCEYTNGAGTCEGAPAGQRYFCETSADCQNVTEVCPNPPCTSTPPILDDVGPCVRNWQTGNFDIALTAQQPTFWRVSTGRTFNPNLGGDPVCVPNGSSQSCPGLFLGINNAFGSVPLPPRTGEFRGELRCVQTEMTGGLNGANALKGEAVIEALDGGGLSKYNSINVEAGTVTAGDRRVVLDGQQYAACPEGITANHIAANVNDPAAESLLTACTGDLCPVRTELTYVPCSQNYQLELPVGFTPELARFDEQEQRLSLEPRYECWANQSTSDPLANIWDGQFANSVFMRTTAVESAAATRDTLPVGGMCVAGDSYGQPCDTDAECGGAVDSCGPQSALLGVVESFYESPLSMTAIGTSAESMIQISEDLTDDADPLNAIARSGRTSGGLACAVGVGGCRFDEILFTEP